MSKTTHVHWLFKEESTLVGNHLCDVPARRARRRALDRAPPIIRQKPGGRLRECASCAKIGKELHIP